jgi:oligopeptide transport system permease protein
LGRVKVITAQNVSAKLMISNLIKKLAGGIVVLIALVAICLALLRNVPGGPFDNERIASPQVQAAMAARYGTDASYVTQLARYLKGISQLDFGPSFQYSDFSVGELLYAALPITLSIGAIALALAWFSAIPVALLAASNPGGALDTAVRAVSTGLLSTPKFVTAPMLALVFASSLHWLPSAGLGEPMWRYLVLPALALALTQFGTAVRVLRGALVDAAGSDALKAARARGYSPMRMQLRHLLPIALPTACAFLVPSAVAVLTGSAVVEQVFALPGLGRALVSAALNRDYTLLLGVVVCCGVIVLLIGWAVELLLLTLDPRRR